MVEAIVVGTSHVSKDSVSIVKRIMDEFEPDVVCIELDEKRYEALLSNKKIRFKEAFKNRIFFLYLFSILQQHIGKKTGHRPGTDMLGTSLLAKKKEIPVALIDKDVEEISKEIKKIPFKEKLKLALSMITGVLIPQKNVDITKVPTDDIIEQAMIQVKQVSPSFYKILVEDRNQYMVDMIENVIEDKEAKKVLVVVGAGHKKEIKEMLEKRDIKTKSA